MAENLVSQEPELAVLSIILRNPVSSYELGGLRFFMFSAIPLQLIMQEIETLIEKQHVPDPELLIHSLEASGNLTKVGGRDFIEYLLSLDKFNPNGFSEYVNYVISAYKARALISNISQITPASMTLDSVDTVISGLRRTLDSLMESSGGTGTVHV